MLATARVGSPAEATESFRTLSLSAVEIAVAVIIEGEAAEFVCKVDDDSGSDSFPSERCRASVYAGKLA